MPDNIVIEDGRITIVEEAKMWSKRDFERLARLAKNDPVTFLDRGFQSVKGGDKRQTRYIQLKKHKKAVEYLLANLDKFPDAKKYGISRADSDIVPHLETLIVFSERERSFLQRSELTTILEWRRKTAPSDSGAKK